MVIRSYSVLYTYGHTVAMYVASVISCREKSERLDAY